MDTQGLGEGTLRTSHRETHAVKRKVAPKAVGAAARALVDACSQYGPIIRNRLDIERMKQPLQKGVFYVAENDGSAEPGFLVFLPGQAPVFLQTKPKAPPPCTLRMRVSNVLGEGGGSILIASLDSIQHTLRLEDVWMWRGAAIFDTVGYSDRRKYLKEFVERFWIPDARLMGGIITTVLNPVSMEKGLGGTAPITAHTVEIIPEQAGRRRLWFAPVAAPTVAKPAAPTVAKPSAQQPQQSPAPRRQAYAKSVNGLPDIYDLFDEQGFPITRAAVQKFALSQELRAAPSNPTGISVIIEWRSDFGGYEIISVRNA